jgi:O-antigen/teichoic acid export membrane protein
MTHDAQKRLAEGTTQTILQVAINRVRAGYASRFLRDGAVLAMGNLITQSLAIFTAPIMARLYDPEAYGLLGLYIAVFGIVTVPATLQYNQAVILPKDDIDALAIMKGGLALGLITAAALSLMCFLPLAALTKGTEYVAVVNWFPLMVLMVLPGCFTTFAMSWLARKQQFRALSIIRMLINLSSTFVGMVLGFMWVNKWGLLVANATGAILGTIALAYTVKQTGGFQMFQVSFETVRKQLKTHYAFPVYATPTQFLAQTIRQAPVLLLTGLAGQAAVGFFNMSNRLLGLPNALFAQSLSEVFRQRAAKHFAEHGECKVIYRKMFWGLLLTTLPVMTFLAVIAPELFAWLLGERWRPAGEYSRILCWLFAIQLISEPLSGMMVIANRQAEDLIVQVIFSVLIVITMTSAFLYFRSMTALLIAFTATSASMNLYYCVRGFRLSSPA